ncbi:tripartite tricarboxylate transporter substrate binding protein [Blastococcus haudaquaticus]|uniref:Tripartite-type tricarboxylate transporter, receptor component TctC n=1 Tax=Blastococcus haudaquaticus TaxID=1938745 RepID=A0A286GTY1_9ACTN|nr:tripartite tricarboxylate transporter substrate binding protein [Blastococcus haudaquaticus]SOD98991.1 Tripartite-type tricarboxylate transporter, receptor component TctC [Blastococcus haudaquaticus]
MRKLQTSLGHRPGKRFLRVGGGALALTLLAACGGNGGGGGGNSASADGCPEGYPERPIELIVPFAAGGGTDVGVRLLAPYIEEELGGATINVVNREGGGGWIGWNALRAAEPDGYTLASLNTPNLISGYLNPEQGIESSLDDFTLIGNVVTDYGAIAVRPDDDRFGTIEELIEYAQENRLTATSTGVGSDDQLASLSLNDALGTQFEGIHGGGAADSLTAVVGGNVDVMFANVGEVATPHENGQLKVLAVLGDPENRGELLSDVPTLAETGLEGVEDIRSWSARGLGGPGGMDEGLQQCIADAAAAAIQNEEFVAAMAEQSLLVDYRDPEEYRQMLEEEEAMVEDLGGQFIW